MDQQQLTPGHTRRVAVAVYFLALTFSAASLVPSASAQQISNGTLTVGVDQNWGAVIDRIIPAGGQNLIDKGLPDPGRELQVAIRRRETPPKPDCFPCLPGCNHVWNPTQGGACNGTGSPVLDLTANGGVIYSRTQLRNFEPDNPAFPPMSEVKVEQTIQFAPGHPNVIQIDYTITNDESFAFADAQELPVVFVKSNMLTEAYRYMGTHPYTYDFPELVTVPCCGENKLDAFNPTEPWVAWLPPFGGSGLGLYVPTDQPHTEWRFHRVGGQDVAPANVMNHFADFNLDPGESISLRAYVIYGTLPEIRAFVYQNEGVGSVISVEMGVSAPESQNLLVDITLSSPATDVVTGAISTVDGGTATPFTDYTPVSRIFEIPVGETQINGLTIPVVNDTRPEVNETVVVRISGVANAVLGTTQTTATILDDDSSPGDPPPAPTQIGPIGTLEVLQPTYEWEPAPFANRYQVRVKDSAGNIVMTASTSATTYGFADPLSAGQFYRWDVRGRNVELEWGEYSEERQFVPNLPFTQRPEPPVATDPSGCITTLTPTFSWQAPPRGVAYRAYITQVNPEVHYPGVDSLGTTFVLPQSIQLEPNRQYRWKVKASNSQGDSDYSPPMYFTPFCRVKGDFNGGLTDMLWQNDVSGKTVVWLMDGVVRVGGTFTTPDGPGASIWKVEGATDLDNNEKTDIIFRNQSTGILRAWLMDGTTQATTSAPAPESYGDVNWAVAATGDLTGDDKDDLIWRHATTGALSVWVMNGLAGVAASMTPTVMDPQYKLVGVADFTGDTKPDLLWHHAGTGQLLIWVMNGLNKWYDALTVPSGVTDLNWRATTVGDYNNDGHADIVWRHAVSGNTVVWYMVDYVRTSGAFTNPTAPAPGWRLAGPH